MGCLTMKFQKLRIHNLWDNAMQAGTIKMELFGGFATNKGCAMVVFPHGKIKYFKDDEKYDCKFYTFECVRGFLIDSCGRDISRHPDLKTIGRIFGL